MKTPRGSTFLVTMLSLIQILSATTSLAPTSTVPQTTGGISTRAPQETTVLSTENPTTSTLLNTLRTTETTNSTTTTTTTRTTTTTTSAVFPSISCENGGTFDGVRCICPDIFYGVTCSNIVDSVEITGRKYDYSVYVLFTILNIEYKDEYSDTTTQEYKDFEDEFKDQMSYLYSEIPEYKEVDILALGPGSVIVYHIVTVELDLGVVFHYQKVLEMMYETLLKLNNCSDWTSTYCLDSIYFPYQQPPYTNDACYTVIPYNYAYFYSLVDTGGSLVCVSVCNANSPNYFHCNGGSCELKYSGPQCLCPRSDMYLYATSRCSGPILLVALYGGVGGAIGVLLISSFILIFFLCRAKRSREDHVYEDVK